MIIKVAQTQSNLKNRFEISVNGEVKYLAGTPWMDISLPLGAENARRCVLTDVEDNLCFCSSYNIAENLVHSAIPARWTFTGAQKLRLYGVMDSENTAAGKIYKLVKGQHPAKYAIEYGDYALSCFDISAGRTRNLLIYSDDVQIAEIVKPMHVTDNLDTYYIFLPDEHSELQAILSFFTVLFDFWKYSHKGEVTAKKKEVRYEYVYDKASKYYDKNWIRDHFDKEAVDAFYEQLSRERAETKADIKKGAKILLLIFGIGWAIVLAVCGYFYLPQLCG